MSHNFRAKNADRSKAHFSKSNHRKVDLAAVQRSLRDLSILFGGIKESYSENKIDPGQGVKVETDKLISGVQNEC